MPPHFLFYRIKLLSLLTSLHYTGQYCRILSIVTQLKMTVTIQLGLKELK